MDILFLFLLAIMSYTLSSIIVQQKIFEELRSWLKKCSTDSPNYFHKKICQLISCMFCTGFWSGVFLTVIGFDVIHAATFLQVCFFQGLFGAFSSYLLHLLMGLLIKKAEEKGIDT